MQLRRLLTTICTGSTLLGAHPQTACTALAATADALEHKAASIPTAPSTSLKQALKQAKIDDALLQSKLGRQNLTESDYIAIGEQLKDLAMTYLNARDYTDCERITRQLVEVTRKHIQDEEPLVRALNILVVVGMKQGKFYETEPIAQECYQLSKRILGPEAEQTLRAMKHLAMVYANVGRKQEGDSLEFEALRLREKVLAPNNPSLATSLQNCAIILSDRRQYDESLKFLRRALAIRIVNGGEEDEKTISVKLVIGEVIFNQSLVASRSDPARADELRKEAEKLLKECLDLNLKLGRVNTAETVAIRETLASIYDLSSNRAAQREEMSKKSQESQRAVFGSRYRSVDARMYGRAEKFWKHLVTARVKNRHKLWLSSDAQSSPQSPLAGAVSLAQEGNLERALAQARFALKSRSTQLSQMQTHWFIADVLLLQGNYAGAQEEYENAVSIAETLTANLPPSQLASLLEFATIAKQLTGKSERLIPDYERYFALQSKNVSSAHKVITYLDRTMRFEQLDNADTVDLSVCCSSWNKLLEVKPGDPEVRAYAFDIPIILAYLLNRHGSKLAPPAEAIAVARQALKQYDYSPAARTEKLLDLCDFMIETADYGQAQLLAAEALKQSALADDSQLACRCLLTSANLSLAQGDYGQAISYSEKAAGLGKQISADQQLHALELLCDSASRAGVATNDSQLIDKALNSARTAIKIQEEQKRTPTKRAQLLVTIGRLLCARGQYAEATTSLQNAIQLCAPLTDGESRLSLADALSELAHLQLLTNDLAAARESASKAIQIHAEDISPVASADQVRDLGLLACIENASGESAGARARALQAAGKLDKYISTVIPALSLAEQRAFLDTISETATTLASVCGDNDSLAQAYGYLMRWKGLLVEGLRKQSMIASAANDPKFAKVVSNLQLVRQEIAAAAGTGSIDRVTSLTGKKEELERQLPGVTDPLGDEGVTELQRHLAADESLVDILTYNNRAENCLHYAAIVTSKSGPPLFVDLGAVWRINDAIGQWRDTGIYTSQARDVTVMDEGGKPAETSAEQAERSWNVLNTNIWKPIASSLPPTAKHIWICEDGELARVPWNMFLLNGAQNGLLLSHVDSPRELVALKKTNGEPLSQITLSPTSQPLLLAGAIAYKNPRLILPGAAQEVEDIEKIAAQSGIRAKVLVQRQPTRNQVIKALSDSHTVHLATHGFFQRDARKLRGNGGVMSGLASRAVIIPSVTTGLQCSVDRNPLLRSGVLLASPEEDKSPDEARLTAEELVGIDLSKCDLLTLSACDTGRGEEVTGQGVMGLRSAIMAGGARSVLLSLWPVDDEATRALMRQFYTNLWSKKLGKSEALKQAQLAIKNDATHPAWKRPFYWSGWQLVGAGWK